MNGRRVKRQADDLSPEFKLHHCCKVEGQTKGITATARSEKSNKILWDSASREE